MASSAANPDTKSPQASALKEQGDQLFAAGKLEEAEQCFRQALAIDPEFAAVHNNLGVLLDKSGRFGEALNCYLQALVADSNCAPAHLNIADWHAKHGNPEEQRRHLEKAIALKPDYFEAHNNLGSFIHLTGNAEEAARCFEAAIKIKPDFALAYINLARCHRTLGRHDEEIRCLERAVSLAPDLYEGHNELGFSLQNRCELEKAEQCHRTAVALNPECPMSRLNLGHALLLQGKYEEGLKYFEARFDAYVAQMEDYDEKQFSSATSAPEWCGQDLTGKTLLLWMEQGFGDNLMMLRFLPELLNRGASRLLVLCRPELARIVRHLPWPIELLLSNAELQPGICDYHCPLTSLPYLLGIRLESIPVNIPYLFVPIELKNKWADRLAARPGPKVGLVWAGNPEMPKDKIRSMAFHQLQPLAAVKGISFVSLQKNRAPNSGHRDDWLILDCIDDCEDFLDTAALIQNLDLVVGVDTSTIHVAGALGKPTWLLNRFESEWRWMIGRSDSLWYPSLRIFRQTVRGDWTSVVDEVVNALRAWKESGWQKAA